MAKETMSQTEGLCKEVANCIRNAYDRGYKQGFKDGNYDKEFFCNLNFEHGTNKGLDDAWECARKLSEMLNAEINQIFNDDIYWVAVFKKYSASEAIAKIKKYEEKQKADSEIKVGDEILIHNIQDAETYKAVVMDIDMDKGLWIFDENACNTVIEPNRYIGEEADIEVRKTGRTFPQIAEVLEQLKGE